VLLLPRVRARCPHARRGGEPRGVGVRFLHGRPAAC
jgi:hypothetical protein